MGRHSDISFYASKNGHFTIHKGKPYRLSRCKEDDRPNGPNYLAALEEFKRIMSETKLVSFTDDSVSCCIDRFLNHIARGSPRSLPPIKSQMLDLRERTRRLRIGQLTGRMIHDWIESHSKWGNTTKCLAFERVKWMTKYNKASLFTIVDPLASLAIPGTYKIRRRGAEYVLEPELLALLLAEAKGRIGEFFFALAKTGARPIELMNAERMHYLETWKMIRFEGNATRGYVWKNARKLKRSDNNRYIYLIDGCEDIVERNIKRHRWLFPNTHGGQITPRRASSNWNRLRSKPKVREWLKDHQRDESTVILYSLRHTYITRAVEKGIQIKTIADLCGTSVKMIEDTYSHAIANYPSMREQAIRCL